MINIKTKTANIAMEIARELIFIEVGERIPTTPYFVDKFSVGFGTVEKALKLLKESEAIKIQARGQMGTYLLNKNVVSLWNISDYGPLVGLLPLPNSKEFEGLATGLTEAFMQAGISFSLNFKNGVKERVKRLLDYRCDFIVLSSNAAATVVKENDELEIIKTLSNYTYYTEFVVMHSKNMTNKDSWRFGVDQTSIDNMLMIEQHFPDNPKVNSYYINMPYLIADGKIDAAIWHNKSLIPLELIDYIDIYPLPEAIPPELSAACIVVHKNKPEINLFFNEICDVDLIERTHNEVITRKKMPSF